METYIVLTILCKLVKVTVTGTYECVFFMQLPFLVVSILFLLLNMLTAYAEL